MMKTRKVERMTMGPHPKKPNREGWEYIEPSDKPKKTNLIITLIAATALLTMHDARAKILGPIPNGGTLRMGYTGIGPNVIFSGPYMQWSLATTGDTHYQILYCTGRISGRFGIHQSPQYLTLERKADGCMQDRLVTTRTDAITPADITELQEILGSHGITPSYNIVKSSLTYARAFPVAPMPDPLPTTSFDELWPISRPIYALINQAFDPAPTAPGSVVSVEYDINEGSLHNTTDNVSTWIEMKVDRINLDDYES
ncbi:hypothetical protein ACBC38_004667 [Salmonella enterica]